MVIRKSRRTSRDFFIAEVFAFLAKTRHCRIVSVQALKRPLALAEAWRSDITSELRKEIASGAKAFGKSRFRRVARYR